MRIITDNLMNEQSAVVLIRNPGKCIQGNIDEIANIPRFNYHIGGSFFNYSSLDVIVHIMISEILGFFIPVLLYPPA